jgi:TetR/AcrR family transcriptional repressor of nem operon
MKTLSVREQLIEHTLVLIRRKGFNGFSYRDLAELVGVKTSSIHYYFPSKDDLVLEAVREYSARVHERIRAIDTRLPPAEQARQYLEPVRTGFSTDQACLVGMLSADVLSLSEPVRAMMREYVQMHEKWLTGLFERAQPLRDKPYPVPPAQLAQVVYGSLQNGLMAARLFGTHERLEASAAVLAGVMPPA